MGDDESVAPSDEAFDFSAYDLEGLRADVRSITDVSGAVSSVARWTFGVPFVAAIVSWLVFAGRIDSGFLLVLFVLGAAAAALPIGFTLGGWLLARKRLDTVTEASGRVVDVIGEMHNDVVRLRAGTADTSVQKVAVGLLEEAIFPAVFGTVTEAAEGMLGPMGFVARKASAGPLKLVEKTVISAIGSLPDRQIGDLVDGAIDATRLDDAVGGLGDDYERVRGNLTGVVERVSRTSLFLAVGLLLGSFVPLALWWLIGFVLS